MTIWRRNGRPSRGQFGSAAGGRPIPCCWHPAGIRCWNNESAHWSALYPSEGSRRTGTGNLKNHERETSQPGGEKKEFIPSIPMVTNRMCQCHPFPQLPFLKYQVITSCPVKPPKILSTFYRWHQLTFPGSGIFKNLAGWISPWRLPLVQDTRPCYS